jgi:transposase-like protein
MVNAGFSNEFKREAVRKIAEQGYHPLRSDKRQKIARLAVMRFTLSLRDVEHR